MNSVERAQRDMLFALVMEQANAPDNENDLRAIRSKYTLKISDNLLRASVEPWESQGFLAVLPDGENAIVQIIPSKYGLAQSTLMNLLQAETFEISWKKEEILHDASDDSDWPGLEGWKQLRFDRNEPSPAVQTQPSHSAVHINFNPALTNTLTTLPHPPRGSAAWFGGLGTWVGVILAALAIYVTLHLAGKI